jgi:cell division septum initiation protein DivIVA
MSEKFVFHGQTTFIEQPRDTVIQNFQNTFIAGDNSDRDKVNLEIKKLIDLILDSKDFPKEEKEDALQALHSVAEQVKEQKGSKLTLKSTLTAVREIVTRAADIADPAIGIITVVLKLLGLS